LARASRKTSKVAKHRSGAKHASPHSDQPSSPATERSSESSQGSDGVKIRIYRQGLGDCFLVSLPRTDGQPRPYNVMIDCGVILGTPDPGTKMTAVVENIAEVTQGEIDLLIATHEHWDHLSGFVQAKDTFDKRLKVHEVWLGWTEDPKDELTAKLKDEKSKALAALRLGLSRMQLAGDAEVQRTYRHPGVLRCSQRSIDQRRAQKRAQHGHEPAVSPSDGLSG
jgi:hypothetical protein